MVSKEDIRGVGWYPRILLKTNEFICLKPAPHLHEYVSNYNITFPTKELMPAGFTVMPCGCATLTLEKSTKGLSVYVSGPTTKPYMAGSQTGQLEILITIEFKPAGLYVFTGIHQSELADQSIDFTVVHPKLNKLLLETVEKAGSIYELVTGFDIVLLEHMKNINHPSLVMTVHNIVKCTGEVTVKKLSEEIYYSERQLNRLFKQHVGTSVKEFSRLVRVNNSFGLLKNPDNSVTLVSDVLGFHDRSHFIRDFKSVCGITPQQYRDNMSDFYINPVKF